MYKILRTENYTVPNNYLNKKKTVVTAKDFHLELKIIQARNKVGVGTTFLVGSQFTTAAKVQGTEAL